MDINVKLHEQREKVWKSRIHELVVQISELEAEIKKLEDEKVRLEAYLLQSDTDYMCPNCVTPWKCNGPHIPQ